MPKRTSGIRIKTRGTMTTTDIDIPISVAPDSITENPGLNL